MTFCAVYYKFEVDKLVRKDSLQFKGTLLSSSPLERPVAICVNLSRLNLLLSTWNLLQHL